MSWWHLKGTHNTRWRRSRGQTPALINTNTPADILDVKRSFLKTIKRPVPDEEPPEEGTWGPARSLPASPAGTWCPPWCPHRHTSAVPGSPAASAPCTGSWPERTPAGSPSLPPSPGDSANGGRKCNTAYANASHWIKRPAISNSRLKERLRKSSWKLKSNFNFLNFIHSKC